jgi:hypothetical protein
VGGSHEVRVSSCRGEAVLARLEGAGAAAQ